MFVFGRDENSATQGLKRCPAETASSIATRFVAGGSARVEQVGQCLKTGNIAILFKWLNIVFPIDFGRVGFGALPSGNRK